MTTTLVNPVKIDTLVGVLQQQALYKPDVTAYTYLENGETETDSLTYQELDKKARAIAAHLQSFLSPEDRVLLLYPSGLDFITAFFGCLYAGMIAIPAYPPRRNQNTSRLESIIIDAQAKAVLTTSDLLENIKSRLSENPDFAELECLSTDDIDSDRYVKWQKPAINGDTLAFLQYTSGSTGKPKGVMVTHRNLLYNEEMIKVTFQHSEKTVFVGWLPLFHDMGLIGNVLQPIYLGIPCYLMSPVDFIQKPYRWLQAISRYKATTSGGPNFAYDLCIKKITPEQIASLDLSSWQVAFNGAEPVRYQTLKQFSDTFASCGFRPETFYPCYGMAETTLLVSGGVPAELPVICSIDETALEENRVVVSTEENSKKIVGCGKTSLEQKIIIVNPDTFTECLPEEVGEIWVAGDNVAIGYWQRPEQTKTDFNAYLADFKTGAFLRTGDLGFLQNGELFVTGRMKDVIIIRGQNHYPQDIEFTVENSHPALKPASGAAFTVEVNGLDRLVIVQEVERTYIRKLDVKEVIGNISQAVTAEHGLQVYKTILVKTGSIPKTSSGKIQRYACKNGFLNNTLNVIGDE
ncbi:fatty acyl-AMP ligase [Anabaena sp. FACHB-1237]|uniref:fatty acyl-AMP ligase n=1 Tax=Anabaena sp. FACHB-1237 TaxID=2692769 RepID=UPI00168105E8|nr:fatty acyl-AMP ligase [Anabaena sp. FACHB-1237]MBD2136217.1 fatty acyl-AMP ligase [Anabaena sp. FACHB-1237]